ncbi:sigma-70 family RNA polymerase sigma factor [Actinoplanes sp. TBRC 11911]|uniref:sigma-70 family RNA polymerase sigma factor n=1 Tax=Actinoplanes sp. TBRC 11911 TaxID=2729386 RepID=UPI00145E0B9E|nr:sigma-70 family RNA polymerase sigma factor [Actinoplanes sp. TBRC 11911]NMO49744.1 sigma-70 family RNA polymerase sigma factor [Actinoplanes sp. TBRC 11911]
MKAEPTRSSGEPEVIEPVDAEARITELKNRHGRALFHFLLRLTHGERDLAEDLLQETLIRAWRNIDRVPVAEENSRRWLFIVARRIAIDAARSRQTRPAEVNLLDVELVSGPNPTTETVLAADAMRRAIRSLSREQRMILAELYLHGSSTKEAARRLGIPLGTVKSRTFYALRSLRDAVLCEGPGVQ